MGAERGEKLRVGEGRAQLRSKACPLTTQERQAQWPGRAGLRRVPGLRSEKSCLFLEKDSPAGTARGQGPPTLRVRPQARPLSSPPPPRARSYPPGGCRERTTGAATDEWTQRASAPPGGRFRWHRRGRETPRRLSPAPGRPVRAAAVPALEIHPA